MSNVAEQKTVFILGLSSDIGLELAKRYSEKEFVVIGTCRDSTKIQTFCKENQIHSISCDVSDDKSISSAILSYSNLHRPWDIFISSVGTMTPIGKFVEVTFSEWEKSVEVNAIKQLSILHALFPFRRKGAMCHVAFFAGSGTNGPSPNYSAYCASKIFLIKMCELLDDEISDMNPFIIGPGWVRTKIHCQTLNSEQQAGSNFERTQEFLESDYPGTSFDEIFNCINWCIKQGKPIAGGRNFSLVHDLWHDNEAPILIKQLIEDKNKFKMRRFKNTD
ncbi:MAG: SDR family NAD(P)-dependent oxidoreductase [Methanoregula sp.]